METALPRVSAPLPSHHVCTHPVGILVILWGCLWPSLGSFDRHRPFLGHSSYHLRPQSTAQAWIPETSQNKA